MLQSDVAQEVVGRDAQHLLRLLVEAGAAHADVARHHVDGVVQVVHVVGDGLEHFFHEGLLILVRRDLLRVDVDGQGELMAGGVTKLEEAVDALVVLTLQLLLATPDVGTQQQCDGGDGRNGVDHPGPPSQPERRTDGDVERGGLAPFAVGHGGLHLETVVVGRQVGVDGTSAAAGVAAGSPLLLERGEAIAVVVVRGGGIVECREVEREAVLPMAQVERPAGEGRPVADPD